MLCPSCSESLAEVQHHGIHVDVCTCGGMWFDHGELEGWLQQQQKGQRSGARVDAGVELGPILMAGGPGADCPQCPSGCRTETLLRFTAGEVRGASCQQCHGIWLSKLDVHRILRLTGSDAADGRSPFAEPAAVTDGGVANAASESLGYYITEGLVHLVAELVASL